MYSRPVVTRTSENRKAVKTFSTTLYEYLSRNNKLQQDKNNQNRCTRTTSALIRVFICILKEFRHAKHGAKERSFETAEYFRYRCITYFPRIIALNALLNFTDGSQNKT